MKNILEIRNRILFEHFLLLLLIFLTTYTPSELNKFPQKKIVVALRPKSSRQDFYGFESFEYMTPHLVKFSSFILSHDTLSIQLAALWNKPTLLLTSNDLKRRISKK